MPSTKPKARTPVSHSHTDVCEWKAERERALAGKQGFGLTSALLITQLRQFPEGNCALSSPLLPPGSMQAADWWEQGGLSQGPKWDHSHTVTHSLSIIRAANAWITVCVWCITGVSQYTEINHRQRRTGWRSPAGMQLNKCDASKRTLAERPEVRRRSCFSTSIRNRCTQSRCTRCSSTGRVRCLSENLSNSHH